MSEHLMVEHRSAELADVRFPERIVTVLAAPYEQPTDLVMYRGVNYEEVFKRGAFRGIETRNYKVRVNLEHRLGDTVGKVVSFRDTPQALIADIKVASTAKGDEVLQLAAEDMVSASVGFAVQRGSDQTLVHRSDPPKRIIHKAFVDHIAFTQSPSYPGSDVLSVRSAAELDPATMPHVPTPRLDEWLEYLESRRAGISA